MLTTSTIPPGGALMLSGTNKMKGSQNVFKNNTAVEHGGGILLGSENVLELSQCVLEGTYITLTDVC